MSVYKSIIDFIKNRIIKSTNDKVNGEGMFLSENLRFLHKLIEMSSNAMYYIDEEGILRYCNKAFSDSLGIDKKGVLGKDFTIFCSEDFGDEYYKIDKELYSSEEKQVYMAQLKCKEQVLRNVIFTQTNFLDDNNEVRGMVGNITDVSEVVRAEKKINRLLKLKEAVLDLNQVIIKENDINVLLNSVLEKITTAIEKADIGAVLVIDEEENVKIVASRGYDEEEVKQFSIRLDQVYYMKETNGVIGKTIIIDNIQGFDPAEHERALNSKDRDKLRCSISTPILFDGRLYGFINIESTLNNAFDENDIEALDYLKKQIELGISKNKLYEETIYLSRYDKLTNLYNRAYFEELLNNNLTGTEANHKEFLFVMFDLNWLKTINDNYGHLAGDELIRVFATTLKNRIGDKNVLARLGGDEFAAIVFDLNVEQLVEMLEDLIKEFKENPIHFENNNFSCSFSYGISCHMPSGSTYNSLLKVADKNMYEHKNRLKSY